MKNSEEGSHIDKDNEKITEPNNDTEIAGDFLFNDDISEANDQGNTYDNLERDDFEKIVTTSYDTDTANDVEEDGDKYTFHLIITINADELSFDVREDIPKKCPY